MTKNYFCQKNCCGNTLLSLRSLGRQVLSSFIFSKSYFPKALFEFTSTYFILKCPYQLLISTLAWSSAWCYDPALYHNMYMQANVRMLKMDFSWEVPSIFFALASLTCAVVHYLFIYHKTTKLRIPTLFKISLLFHEPRNSSSHVSFQITELMVPIGND